MSKRALVFPLAAATLTSALNVASAQPAPRDKAPPPPPPAPAVVKASAIVQIASDVAQAMGTVPAGALVVASPVTSDLPAPKGEELAVRIATHVAGRLGVARAHDKPATLAVARGHAGRAASLVYLQVEIVKGELRVTADLYPVVSNGWERLRNPAPGPRAHGFASAPLDAEIRAFLAPVVLEQAQIHKAKHDEGEVLAIGCGDVDADGGLEIVLVSRARVTLGRLRAGKLVVQKSVPWSALASRTPVPMREALASAVFTRKGELLVGTTDRGGVVVDAALVVKRQLAGLPVPGAEGDACSLPSAEWSAFEGDAVSCVQPAKGDAQVVLASPASRYDALAKLDAVGKDGSITEIVAAREPSTGKLRVRRQDPGGGKPVDMVADAVGAQFALADLDLDGVPEVITTTESDVDTLVVSNITKTQVAARLRFPAKEGVRALAVCPPEERGVPGLVAVVGSEVWLVR